MWGSGYLGQLLAHVKNSCHYWGPSLDPASSALSAVKAGSLSLDILDVRDWNILCCGRPSCAL